VVVVGCVGDGSSSSSSGEGGKEVVIQGVLVVGVAVLEAVTV
jgi:hypothetical protein